MFRSGIHHKIASKWSFGLTSNKAILFFANDNAGRSRSLPRWHAHDKLFAFSLRGSLQRDAHSKSNTMGLIRSKRNRQTQIVSDCFSFSFIWGLLSANCTEIKCLFIEATKVDYFSDNRIHFSPLSLSRSLCLFLLLRYPHTHT